MTNEQLLAYIAFGLLIMSDSDTLIEAMGKDEFVELANDVTTYLSGCIDDDDDMVSPVVSVLKDAIKQAKANV